MCLTYLDRRYLGAKLEAAGWERNPRRKKFGSHPGYSDRNTYRKVIGGATLDVHLGKSTRADVHLARLVEEEPGYSRYDAQQYVSTHAGRGWKDAMLADIEARAARMAT